MIEVVEFKKEHMIELVNEPHNAMLKPMIQEAQLAAIEGAKLSYSILESSTKKVLFCGGVSEYWKNRGECWAVFHDHVKDHFVQIHRAVKRYFQMVDVGRIEAAVKVDFEEGHRWIKLLGFKKEAECLKRYLPDGSDVSLYVRIK